jgi:hypothetical protein
MTCKETIQVICEYMEGRLSFPAATDVRAHLRQCRDCRLVHEAAQSTLRVYFNEDVAARSPRARVA